MNAILNTKELIDAFEIKANQAGLSVNCPADGLFKSEIAIVAEAPGDKEVASGSPLTGGSGGYLWTVLRKHGISRTDCYITNAAKRQVAFSNDDDRASLGKHEQTLWYELLKWELSQLPNLRIVIALGNHALKALTGHDGITKWRGSVLEVQVPRVNVDGRVEPRTVRVVAAYNPAFVLRAPVNELIFQHDMSRVGQVIAGTWKPHPIDVVINPSYAESIEFIRHIRASKEPIASDIETMGGETACIGIANGPHNAFCINFRTRTENRFTLDEEESLLLELAEMYNDPDIDTIWQNGGFDMSWLWFKNKIKVKPAFFDTMLAHHCLYPWMPHDLGYICTQYTNHPYYKDEKDTWRGKGDIDQYWTYNGKDCAITYAAATKMLKELEKQKLADFFFDHVMQVQPHLVRMVVGGIKMDLTKRAALNEGLRSDLEDYKQAFYRAVHAATGDSDYYPNPLSPTQLSELLFKRLRLVGRGASTNEENRQRMAKDYRTNDKAREVLRTIDVYKEEHKFYSTYVDTDIDEDGRMRCSYSQSGVKKAPGRLSSSKVLWGHWDERNKKFINHGMNLQNQPKRAYEMFEADEDYTFVYFDLSQAEARFVAWDAEIHSWMEDFERARIDSSYDAHRALASSMFKVPYADVPTDDEIDGRKTIRFTAKRCRHGLNYRMEADRLATTTGLPLHEAQRAYELYHRETPELRKWWAALTTEAQTTRMLFNYLGRRLYIQGNLYDPTTLESIVAFRPQSSIGDKVCRVIKLCERDEEWPIDARMGLNVHDALIALAPIQKAKQVARIMKRHAEEPLVVKPSLPPLIIPADLGIALPGPDGVRRWSTIQKVKYNELDDFDLMKEYPSKK